MSGILLGMALADVIVTAFSIPTSRAWRGLLMAQAENLPNDLVIVEVPFQQLPGERLAYNAFKRSMESLGNPKTGYLRSLIRNAPQLRGKKVNSISLVGFSAGCTAIEYILKSVDAPNIDSVVLLDGLHLSWDYKKQPFQQQIDPFLNFIDLASRDERLFVMAHTGIIPDFHDIASSTTETAGFLYSGAQARNPSPVRMGLATNLLVDAPPPPPPLKIQGKDFGSSMPAPGVKNWGNAWFLNYGGRGPEAHIFTAWAAQVAVWRAFLMTRLRAPVHCAGAAPSAPSGLGDDDCAPSRVILDPSEYETMPEGPQPGEVMAAGGLALACFALSYIGLDWYLTHRRSKK